ncbi:Protein CBG22676 [Caenorhabditis briggsae]|uniref:Protein CBG22676 n=2 Tax=Caenorhabditis briggsae TaxID=6238 RepID=A8Y2X7_CAEBR|nr:Protein CBG22676 [Caenorhabditis briggsae]ULT84149.1 hypothetical protein L3Y34_013056 [Caenorhabditis briggsae]CAP39218.1 Protein CBG22676 [Caenorhabditis briggsae]
MLSRTAILLSCSLLAIATAASTVRSSMKNTVEDAQEQLTKKIRCWEPIEENIAGAAFSGQHRLSEAVYELCSYMPDPKNWSKGYVNGVDMDSDDYTTVLHMFQNVARGYAVLNVCLQEGFQFHVQGRPSQVSMRCLCKRDGCNLPKGFTEFLEYNKLPMPETTF